MPAQKQSEAPNHIDIPDTIPLLGKTFSRVDFVPDHRTPQGTLQLGKVCLVPKSGNIAEAIILPVLYNKDTGNRFASYGMTRATEKRPAEYRRNIQGIVADSVEEYRALQALAQGFVKAAVNLYFQPIKAAEQETVEEPKEQTGNAAAATV